MTESSTNDGGLRDELRGLRGLRVGKWAKYALTRWIGRAFWFDHLGAAIEYAMRRHRERRRPLTYYEFGTGSGSTLQRAISILRRIPDSRIYLFDSFAGLPAVSSPRDALLGWREGGFAFSEEYIRQVIVRSGFPLGRVSIYKGYFEQTLTATLREELGAVPPAFVTVDADYYSSTRAVLEFLMPLLVSGATFYFDDLWSFDGHPEYGQLKAIADFNQACGRGQLTPNPIFGNRIYTYYNHEFEFRSS